MKKIKSGFGLLFIMLFFCLNSNSQSIVSEKYFGNAGVDGAYDIKTLADGGFIIAGNRGTVPGAGFGLSDIYLIRMDAKGDTIWTRTYGNAYDENANSIAVLPEGGFVITGFESTNFNASSRNVFLMKLDNNGNKLWKKNYGGNGDDEGNEIKRTPDGGFIIAGLTESYGAGGRDAYLIKTNVTGDTLWTRTFGKGEFDDSWDVELTTDGGYMLTGGSYSYAAGSFDDAWLIKTDANGKEKWIKNYGVINKVDWAWALTSIRSGGFAFVGVKNTAESGMDGVYGDLHFVKVDNNGNLVWDKSIHADYRMEGTDIQETKDNGFIIGGYKLSREAQWFCIVKTNSNGDVLWEKVIGKALSLNRANAITETTDGGFAAVGFRSQDFNVTTEDIYFVKVNNGLTSSVDQNIKGADLYQVEVYPNPANETLHFSSPVSVKSISIFDATGRLVVKKQSSDLLNESVDVSELSNGVYSVILSNSTNSVAKRIVIFR